MADWEFYPGRGEANGADRIWARRGAGIFDLSEKGEISYVKNSPSYNHLSTALSATFVACEQCEVFRQLRLWKGCL